MRVGKKFIIRNIKFPLKNSDLSHASIDTLCDETENWSEKINLNGFIYNSIGNRSPIDSSTRIKWLEKQICEPKIIISAESNFYPQPWQQIRKVLREMGHREEARKISVALEKKLRETGRYRNTARIAHIGYGLLTGYGYRPMRLIAWMVMVWVMSAAFYWFSALPPHNVFAPSNPLVFQNPTHAFCDPESDIAKAEQSKPEAERNPAAGNWYLCENLPQEYTGFSPLAYSLDVILPLVDLQQQKDWGPMIPTPLASRWREGFAFSMGHITRLVIWFETLFGWLASLLLVAIVSGLTKRRED
jgi:hypothetical protein